MNKQTKKLSDKQTNKLADKLNKSHKKIKHISFSKNPQSKKSIFCKKFYCLDITR